MRRRHQQRGRWAWQTYALLLTVGVVSIYGFTRRRPQTPAATKQLRVTASSVQSSVRVVEESGLEEERRKMWAVAVMLSMNPSLKADGWKPRSVKGSSSNGTCPVGGSLCAALVLRHSLVQNGGLGDDADFVVLIDSDAPSDLESSLLENGARPVRMELDEFLVFRDYLLLRKLYVFSLTSYERVLLLDLDGVVTGSLRFLFEASMVCGEEIAPIDRNTGEHCVAVDPEVCEHGETAEILAQQTSGTPVLTAYMMVRPDDEVWRDVANELNANCGGGFVCDRKRVNSFGWGSATGTAIDAPHDWATRAKPKRFVKKDAADLSWSRMGAGFSDQGFVEYLFALKRRRAKLVSKWSCAKRLHYLHFNVPPKPWNCPENEACRRDIDTRTTNAEYSMDASALRHDRGGDFERRPRSQRLQEQQKRKEWWDSPSETLAFGGHHCAQDWWWQYDLARASLRRSPGSCVATCAADLDLAMERRRDPSYENYTPGPRCAHLWEKKNSHSSSSSSSK